MTHYVNVYQCRVFRDARRYEGFTERNAADAVWERPLYRIVVRLKPGKYEELPR